MHPPHSAIDRRTILAGAGALGLSGMSRAYARDVSPTPVVDTTSGKVRGAVIGGVYDFKGIHYGADTTGAARFMPPKRVAPWTGVRETVAFGPRCSQVPWETIKWPAGRCNPPAEIMANGGTPSADLPMNEDCLVLNVSTTGLKDGAKRPVMVFFHGGGFSVSTNSMPLHSGTNLARNGDGVVVTVNHRLNIFGYLFLGDIGGEPYAASGNAGLLDLVLALEWVRDNIEQFGGDPHNVTIFGQSGGAAKVSCVLAMPAAKGLVHKAILQSGSPRRFAPREQQAEKTRTILRMLGLTPQTFRRLHDMPAEKLVALPGMSALGALELQPLVDGVSLFEDPLDASGPGASTSVPMMIDTMVDETMFLPMIGGDPKFGALTDDDVRDRMKPTLGARTEEAMALYKAAYPNETPSYRWAHMTTDASFFTAWQVGLAERSLRHGNDHVYASNVSWRMPGYDGFYRAAHCVDLAFVFDNVDVVPQMTGRTPEAHRLGETMSRAWMSFARSGDPNHTGMPNWPRYTTADRKMMNFDRSCRVLSDPRRDERRFWSKA